MMFKTDSYYSLIENLIEISGLEVVRGWQTLTERERLAALPIVEDAVSFSKRTMYRNVASLLADKESSISPLQALVVTQQINRATSKRQMDNFFRRARIKVGPYELSKIKPLAINSVDVLVKLYLCLSFDDAYLYVQIAKIMRNYDLGKLARQRNDITIAHENVANMIQWYRIARAMGKGFFEEHNEHTSIKYPEDERLYPPIDLVMQVINNTVAIIEEMRIFPRLILKMLRETPDIASFFITVDALYLSLTNEFRGQEVKVRHKLALLYLVRDIIDDSATWTLLTL